MNRPHILALMLACAVLLAVVANATQLGSKSASESSDSSTQVPGDESRDNGHTATSARAKAQTSKKAAAKAQTQPNATAKGQLHSSAGTNSPNPAGRALNERELVSPGDTASLGQESQRHGVSPAKGATIPPATVSNAMPAPHPTVGSRAAITSGIPRHRNPNPAVIEGTDKAKAVNTGALSGTGVHRKP